MDYRKIIVGILFFIGAYMIVDVLASIIRNDVEQDIKQKVLQDTLMGSGSIIIRHDKCTPEPLKNVDRVIQTDLEPGCVNTPSNMKLWKEVENVGSNDTCKKPIRNLKQAIRNTRHHGDKLLDSYRDDLIQSYNDHTKIDLSDKDLDPYDPEMYASFNEQKKACIQPHKEVQKLDKPLTGHQFITKDACDNPAPVKYPILSDTHYLPDKIGKYTYIPAAEHCSLEPGTNKIISSNLISDKMLTERMGSYKSMITNNISSELISTDRIKYDAAELVPQYNPADNNLYKVEDRKPVTSMDQHAISENVCGFDYRYSSYAELENNDLKETTCA